MAVRSARLWGPQLIAPLGGSGVYTCPAGATVIIKRMTLRASSGGSANIGIFIGVPGSGTIVLEENIPASTTQDREEWWVLEPGDVLTINNDGPLGSLTTTGHGAILAGVA